MARRGAYGRGKLEPPKPPAPDPESYFSDPEQAYEYLEKRGYTLTKLNNWLPPANIPEPSKKDHIAALYLGHASDYGGIIKVKRCPFCGGRADPRSTIGVECEDCEGNAPDIEAWQKRSPP